MSLSSKHQIEIMETILRKRRLQIVKEEIDELKDFLSRNPKTSIDLAQLAINGMDYVRSIPPQLEG